MEDERREVEEFVRTYFDGGDQRHMTAGKLAHYRELTTQVAGDLDPPDVAFDRIEATVVAQDAAEVALDALETYEREDPLYGPQKWQRRLRGPVKLRARASLQRAITRWGSPGVRHGRSGCDDAHGGMDQHVSPARCPEDAACVFMRWKGFRTAR